MGTASCSNIHVFDSMSDVDGNIKMEHEVVDANGNFRDRDLPLFALLLSGALLHLPQAHGARWRHLGKDASGLWLASVALMIQAASLRHLRQLLDPGHRYLLCDLAFTLGAAAQGTGKESRSHSGISPAHRMDQRKRDC